jgi:hypothetical protein
MRTILLSILLFSGIALQAQRLKSKFSFFSKDMDVLLLFFETTILKKGAEASCSEKIMNE